MHFNKGWIAIPFCFWCLVPDWSSLAPFPPLTLVHRAWPYGSFLDPYVLALIGERRIVSTLPTNQPTHVMYWTIARPQIHELAMEYQVGQRLHLVILLMPSHPPWWFLAQVLLLPPLFLILLFFGAIRPFLFSSSSFCQPTLFLSLLSRRLCVSRFTPLCQPTLFLMRLFSQNVLWYWPQTPLF